MLNESKLHIYSKNGILDIEGKAANVPMYNRVAEVDLRICSVFSHFISALQVASGTPVQHVVTEDT